MYHSECPCTPPFPALLIIKSKQWTLLACVKYAQDFPTNTRTLKTTAEGYEIERQNISVHFVPFCSRVFFGSISFIYSTFLESLLYAKHYVVFSIYIVKSFSSQKEGILHGTEFPLDVNLRLMSEFLTIRSILRP